MTIVDYEVNLQPKICNRCGNLEMTPIILLLDNPSIGAEIFFFCTKCASQLKIILEGFKLNV